MDEYISTCDICLCSAIHLTLANMDLGESLGKPLESSNPILKVFHRRKRYDATVRVITQRRHELFRDAPIDQLVSLAFFSTPTDLKTFAPDNPGLPSLVLQKYESEESNDLFHDWQLFCKAVDDHGERSEYLVGLWLPRAPRRLC